MDYVTGNPDRLESFSRQHVWAVRDIPDPKDENPVRYAFLAYIPHLLFTAFNEKITLGATRDPPAILSPEQAEDYRTRSGSTKVYETVPGWTKHVEPLPQTLTMRTDDDIVLNDLDVRQRLKDRMDKRFHKLQAG